MARPTKYEERYNKDVIKLCKLGATDKDIADFFDVSEATINNWKIEHPAFLESIKKGKIIADSKVSESLYKRAIGYQHKEDKIFQYEGQPVIVNTVKHYAPDPTSMIFWLKNRRPKEWRDKKELDVDMKTKISISDLRKAYQELKE